MKIIEALKELPILEKRIHKNIDLIGKYSSDVANDEDQYTFGSSEIQRKEVKQLLQSINDLVERKAYLRKQLAVTNANTEVNINEKNYTIAEWIEIRQNGINNILLAYNNMNDMVGRNRMNSTQFDPEKGIRVVRFYDEKERNDKISQWEDISNKIDSQLEIINATTDLVE